MATPEKAVAKKAAATENKPDGTRKVGETHTTINSETEAANLESASKDDPNVSADDMSEEDKTTEAYNPERYMVNAAQFYTTSSPVKTIRLDDITATRILTVDQLAREILTRADILENRYELIPVLRDALTEYFESEKPYYYRGLEEDPIPEPNPTQTVTTT